MEPNILELLHLSDDALLEQVGKDISGRNARGEPPDLLIRKAKDWLKNRSEEFKSAICSNKDVRTILNMPPSEDRQLQLVAAIGDVLLTVLVGIPPFSIAAQLVRVGLDSLCKDCGNDGE